MARADLYVKEALGSPIKEGLLVTATSMSMARQDMQIWLSRFPDRKEVEQFTLSLQNPPPPANGLFLDLCWMSRPQTKESISLRITSMTRIKCRPVKAAIGGQHK